MTTPTAEPETGGQCCGINVRRDYEVDDCRQVLFCPDCGKTYTRESVRIAALERERDALREALRPFAALDVDAFAHFQNKPDDTEVYTMNASTITLGDIRRAREALGETK